MIIYRTKQSGAVSLFVVIFTTLLITVISLSFLRLVLRDQDQATTTDLSQSAYDSAQAGVEDGKRAILRYQAICSTGTASECQDAATKLNSSSCNVALDKISTVTDDEVIVQTNDVGNNLDQAYTCVMIRSVTDDYLGVLKADSSKVIPLISESQFNRVKLEWYSPTDLGATTDYSVDLPSVSSTSLPLLTKDVWKPNRPSIIRAQLMQVGSTFKLTDFDDTNVSGESNTNTLFLYPSARVDSPKSFTGLDIRKTFMATGRPQAVTCKNKLADGGYACSAELVLPNPIGGGDRNAWLRLSAYYNKTNFRLSLLSDSTSVKFNGVQPEIDSTGRANDLFRRVKTRVEAIDPTYPDATIDITGNFCKDFIVTDNTTDYRTSCNP